MEMKRLLVCFTCIAVSVALVVQMLGCGTIIYPERRGQKTGQIDVGIALLDALWLLVFIVPGVVAFAVDFTTGAIYLPSRRASAESDRILTVRLDPSQLDETTIRKVVKEKTGCSESDLNRAMVFALDPSTDVEAKLREIARSGYRMTD